MPQELGYQANRGVVGQDGLAVMRWDFGLMVNGFVSAGEVPPNRTSPTEWANLHRIWDISGAVDAASTGFLQP